MRKGHFFEDNLDSCPHCPKGTAKADEKKLKYKEANQKMTLQKLKYSVEASIKKVKLKLKETIQIKEPSFDLLKPQFHQHRLLIMERQQKFQEEKLKLDSHL